MGCLNSEGKFSHWFGNIHLSGPCNRSCYFCIGQHMMAVDHLNVLEKYPLRGLGAFLDACAEKRVKEVYVTGTNTDPLLYKHLDKLNSAIKSMLPDVKSGIRTNGALLWDQWEKIGYSFDKFSITICSFDPDIYQKMMGQGSPPNLRNLISKIGNWRDVKVNVVLGPENMKDGDVFKTINECESIGIARINLREPYGQPHIGNPFEGSKWPMEKNTYGMPTYKIGNTLVTYWDVHYVEVESVNLYANGYMSVNYPITKGVNFDKGDVKDQSHFVAGRQREQWTSFKK